MFALSSSAPHFLRAVRTTEGPMAMQESRNVATDETSSLISSDKVEGTAVYDRKGEKLGSIHTVMIDKISGKVAYAVMSFGGFLGIGDRYHPLPWHVLTYETGEGGYVVDLDQSKLEGAPTYGTSETPNWSDRRWGQQVHDYYGARPYWE
jgi:PRC-barrel domain